jgi:hypothetical protein
MSFSKIFLYTVSVGILGMLIGINIKLPLIKGFIEYGAGFILRGLWFYLVIALILAILLSLILAALYSSILNHYNPGWMAYCLLAINLILFIIAGYFVGYFLFESIMGV